MISTLVDLLGSFYANNDLANVETIARSLHAAIPGDQVSLQFLGLVYYRMGRVKEAVRVFDKVACRHAPSVAATSAQGDSAVEVCYREATRRNPSLAKAWYDLGNALLALRKFELAIPAFRSSLRSQLSPSPVAP